MKNKLTYYPKKILSTLKNEGVSALYKLIYSFIISRFRRKFTRDEKMFKSWSHLKK